MENKTNKTKERKSNVVRPFKGFFRWLSGLKPFYGKGTQAHFVHGSAGNRSASPGVALQGTARNGKEIKLQGKLK